MIQASFLDPYFANLELGALETLSLQADRDLEGLKIVSEIKSSEALHR